MAMSIDFPQSFPMCHETVASPQRPCVLSLAARAMWQHILGEYTGLGAH